MTRSIRSVAAPGSRPTIAPTPAEREAIGAWAGGGWRVLRTRRLMGGVSSIVHLVTLQGSHRQLRQVVVRRLFGDRSHGASMIRNEATVLTALSCTAIAAPRLLFAAPDGLVRDGPPALLMTRAGGQADLAPADPASWLQQMACTAAAIHGVDIHGPPFHHWRRTEPYTVPTGALRPELWRAAHAALCDVPPAVTLRFIHRDFQHFNLLWRRGRLSAVLDWAGATNGPAAIDVGHCRLNLAVLFSPDMADDFLHRYEAEAGTTVDPWWDLDELLAYNDHWPRFIPQQVAGRATVDLSGMCHRVEATIDRCLRRLR